MKTAYQILKQCEVYQMQSIKERLQAVKYLAAILELGEVAS